MKRIRVNNKKLVIALCITIPAAAVLVLEAIKKAKRSKHISA